MTTHTHTHGTTNAGAPNLRVRAIVLLLALLGLAVPGLATLCVGDCCPMAPFCGAPMPAAPNGPAARSALPPMTCCIQDGTPAESQETPLAPHDSERLDAPAAAAIVAAATLPAAPTFSASLLRRPPPPGEPLYRLHSALLN